jgi:hypothetical protein
MPVVTVQLGQCGNQLGYSLFETLACELDRQDYGIDGWETFFRPAAATAGSRDKSCTARAVLIDMEPKVGSHTLGLLLLWHCKLLMHARYQSTCRLANA